MTLRPSFGGSQVSSWEFARFTLASPADVTGEDVVIWLQAWGWTGKVERSAARSRSSTHHIAVKIEDGKDFRCTRRDIRASWRGYLLSKKKKAVAKQTRR